MRHTRKMSFRTHPLQQSPTYDDRPTVSSKTRFVCLMSCVRASAQLGLVLAKQTISQLSTVLSERTRQTLEKRPFCLNFSSCLSRACLGKMIVFIYKLLKKGVFWSSFAPCTHVQLSPESPCGYTRTPAPTHARTPLRSTNGRVAEEKSQKRAEGVRTKLEQRGAAVLHLLQRGRVGLRL